MRRLALVVCLCAAATGSAAAQPGDWTVRRDPFDKAVVARWKAILAKYPYDAALSRLTALYRKHRSLLQLEEEYRKLPETWANVVVLAQLTADRAHALALFQLAVKLDNTDLRGWIAIGDASKPADARVAYERALALAPPLPLQRAVLKKLAALSGDPEDIDRAYARLLELDPKNGRLWLERGDALLAAGRFGAAVPIYDRAEPLLKTDPERRLTVIAQRGRVHELLGNTDLAITAYNRAIALSPRGYYLRAELIARIIAIHTNAHTLPALLREYQRAWPEKSRGHFEWSTLAQLYQATHANEAAIRAYQQAVAAAPRELATQRALVKLLDAEGRHDDALAQLEAAAKAVPGDAPIRFELVQRYWNLDKPRLLATLQQLSTAHPRNIGVHRDLAELYQKLRRIDLATREYEIIAKLEPDEQNLIMLGDAYWTAGKEELAVTTWKRMARANTAKADAALGAVLLDHDLTEEALEAYTRAIDRDPENPELWRARGAVYEAAARWSSAAADTDKAVALLGAAPRDVGHAARYQMIRILTKSEEEVYAIEGGDFAGQIREWESRFELHDDLMSGYLLAEYYGRFPSALMIAVLEQLHALVPADHGVTLELIRAYRSFKHYDKAIALADQLRSAAPARKEELDAMITRIEDDKRMRPAEIDWDDGGQIDDPAEEIEAARPPELTKDTARSAIRAGVRVGVGTGLRGPASSYLTTGAIGTFGAGPIAFVARVDLAQREGQMRSATALAGSVGVAAHALTTRRMSVTLGAAQRFEHRFGDRVSELDHDGLAVDFTLDFVARNWPTALGLRLEQGLYQQARDTSLLFELGVELR